MLLSAEHLSINFGSRQLLDDVNFYLNEGDKVGVIGINGTGKSTFEGSLRRHGAGRRHHLPEPQRPGQSAASEPGNGGIRHGAGAGLPPLPRRVPGAE